MPFRDITGHVRLVELLKRSIARGTLPPSLIFAGPAGSGKRATAIALAQALNCPQSAIRDPQSAIDSCGVCASCTRIARGVHPDVLIVEPGDNGAIKVDQVRDIVDRAAYRPFEGKRRVVIVNDADVMVAHAQNGLLKTLEEPPSLSVFVLVTSRPDMLLATVRSRCIRLTFAAAAHVELDHDACETAGRVLAQTASASAAPGARLESAKLLLVNTGGGGAEDREALASQLHAMSSLLRDVELLATNADAALANPDAKSSLDRLVPSYRGERGLHAFAAVDRALAALDMNANTKLVADWVVMQL
jgi:DNA polymerase-3 subunit delta'